MIKFQYRLYLCILALACFCNPSIQANEQARRISRITPQDVASYQQEDKVALLVGVDQYPQGSGLSQLHYAKKDMQALAKEFTAQGYLVKTLTDGQATKAVVLNYLDSLADLLDQQQGTLVFAFSGHGFGENGNNYLATYETSTRNISSSGLALKEVEQALKKTGAIRRVMFIDACRNDPGSGARSANLKSFADYDAEGLRVLFSTKAGKVSYENAQLQHGVFSYYLIQALQGKAAKNGILTFRNIAEYVRRQVKNWSFKQGELQVPYEAGEFSGDFLLGQSGDYIPPTQNLAETEHKPIVQPSTPLSTQLQQQLNTCSKHIQAQRLTTGHGGNALDCYTRILQQDPYNQPALEGIQRIEQTYIEWVNNKIQQKRYQTAQNYLHKIRKINPENQQLAILENKMAKQKKAQGIKKPSSKEQFWNHQTAENNSAQYSNREQFLNSHSHLALSEPSPENHLNPNHDLAGEFIKIPSGCFQMGSNRGDKDEQPIHQVCLTQDFYIGKYEVTQGQWEAIMGTNPAYFKKGKNYPIENISWDNVQVFINKLNKQSGQHYRLPTEAEWEYAAKAGTNTKYSWGNHIDCRQASYNGGKDSRCYYQLADGTYRGPSPVGSYPANPWGIYDMHGNVWEWVQDWYGKNYYQNSLKNNLKNNPKGPVGGSSRGIRGGGWFNSAWVLRSAFRVRFKPSKHNYNLGFRLARSL